MAIQKLWSAIEDQNIDFEWYYAKADMQVKFDDFTMGGMADIRIRKDSVIFISVRKFGLELARVLVRPDSVFMLNRLQANYMTLSIDSLQSVYQVPFDFAQLQETLVGNHLTNGMVPISSQTVQQGHIVKSADDYLQVDYLLNSDNRVLQANYFGKDGHSVEVEYSDLNNFESLKLPSKRDYFYPNKEDPEYTLNVVLDKIEINQPKRIRFEIPSNYTRL